MKKLLLTCLMFLMPALAISETIKVVTEGSYEPWSFIDKEKGELVGYDVDVATQICQLAQLECEIYTHDWSSIISSIRFHKYDIILAGLEDNDDRRRVIDFSTNYAKASSQFITLAGRFDVVRFCYSCAHELDIRKAKDEKTLKQAILSTFTGRKIAAQKNTTSDKYLRDELSFKDKVEIVEYKTMDEVIDAVISGQVDGAVGDTSYLIDVMKEKSELPILRVGPELVGQTFGRGVAVAMRQDASPDLKQKINSAIAQLRDEGKLELLSLKWFEYDISP